MSADGVPSGAGAGGDLDRPSADGQGAAPAVWHLTTDGTPAEPGPEGFVHASLTDQLAGTLRLHFAGVERIVLLRLDRQRLGDALVFEPSRGGEDFPHIYRALRLDDLIERRELLRVPGGDFELDGLPA